MHLCISTHIYQLLCSHILRQIYEISRHPQTFWVKNCNYFIDFFAESIKSITFTPYLKLKTIMNKIIVTSLLVLFAMQINAQIEMFDESIKKVEEPKALPYDSLTNMVTMKFGTKENYKYTFDHLVGQTLMFCGDPYSYGGNNGFNVGSYYKVTGTLPDDVGKGLYCRMTLVDTKTGEHKEEGDLSTSRFNARWVVVGHYEKMKALYVNKEYVYVGTKNVYIHYSWKKANGLINMETDTVTRGIPEESVWTCIGVQVKPRRKTNNMNDDMQLDNRSPIVLIFDNPTYGKHYCYLENDEGRPYKALLPESLPYVCGRFQIKSSYDKIKAITAANKAKRKALLTKKYGPANAKLILEGTVRIGMTKAMCEESWGTPDDINKSIGSWGTHEQWVYGNSYLYFEGNRLTAIQN